MSRGWRHAAVCRDEDPELFFPIGTSGPALAQAIQAVAVCNRCPVRAACLAWAIDNQVRDGIWGGLTEQQRRRMGIHTTRRYEPVLCRAGLHELSGDNVYTNPTTGKRTCKACQAANHADWYQRQKAQAAA